MPKGCPKPSQGCSCLCIVIPDKGAQRPLIRYPAPLSKGAAFCLCIVKTKEQNASRFGICAGSQLGARYRSLVWDDRNQTKKFNLLILNKTFFLTTP
jgi:hypothetical protein